MFEILQVGGLISERLKHPKKWLIELALWMLSTWIGTFILCGLSSISLHFPYFQTFSQLPLHKREQILHSWSLSFFYPLRMLFKAIKLLALVVFFSQVQVLSLSFIFFLIFPLSDWAFTEILWNWIKNTSFDFFSRPYWKEGKIIESTYHGFKTQYL